MSFFDHQHYYLVGIKGVAMTSMAQLLLDAGKHVAGSDVPEIFVTEKILSRLPIQIETNFDNPLPAETDCVIYTAAHQGKLHPQVKEAQAKHIPIFSHAEALSFFFNNKQGIAVCGVGGKSTVSAMITWILEKSQRHPSYSVGVGNVIGLNKTGQWRENSEFFVAEADEYVTDPAAIQQGETAIPRFSYLQPFVTVCTHLKFDHPDVYRDQQHTNDTFNTFFSQIKEGGTLIINSEDKNKVTVDNDMQTFGTADADLIYGYNENATTAGVTRGTFKYRAGNYPVTLQVPGEYNLENAAAATLAAVVIGVPVEEAVTALASFQSTSRRFEKVGEWHGVPLYDDYAHHPSEIQAVLAALKKWHPMQRKVVAFQPHTYSRTKALFTEFAHAFKDADVVVLLDIFASAREKTDPSINTQQLVDAVKQNVPVKEIYHVSTPSELASFCHDFLKENDVFLTIGAGDIYKMYEFLGVSHQDDSLLQVFQSQFPHLQFQANHALAPYTTVKIGGPAELFVIVTKTQDLIDVVLHANSHQVPVTILGWGANSLISDAGIKGLVIKNACQDITVHDEKITQEIVTEYKQIKVEPRWNAAKAPETPSYEFTDLDYNEDTAERVAVTMDAGVSLPAAINILLAKGITGLQWYSRIPASVGGAIYNNIHGGTHFIGEVVVAVDVITEDNQHTRYTVDQLDFDYDFSRFHHSQEVILSTDFLLFKGDVAKAQKAAIEWARRKSVQPQNSLGCVFQNISAEDQQRLQVPTPSIGYLIQHVLKLQGYRVGDAQVSNQHAAFIENLGSATATDYLTIIKKIVAEAKEKCQLELKTEIFFLGFTEQELAGIVHSRSAQTSATG